MKTPIRPYAACLRTGFTLLELLVSLGIIAMLSGLAIPLIQGAQQRGRAAREISAAKSAMVAWHSYAAEHDGLILPGFKQEPGTTNTSGKKLSYPLNARYPFRLAPYLENRLQGTLLVNEQAKVTTDYEISMTPSLGLNVTFVGGDFSSTSDLIPSDEADATYGSVAVRRILEIGAPSKLIVFASARYSDATHGNVAGYHLVKSPNFWSRRWPDAYGRDRVAAECGFIDLRHSEKAACAMADGHVELLSYDQLEDMRRWSNQAAEEDNPDWILASQ